MGEQKKTFHAMRGMEGFLLLGSSFELYIKRATEFSRTWRTLRPLAPMSHENC